jgi:hypothetical protein
MRLDANGVAGFDRGAGNHAVHFQGAKRLPSGEWVLDLVNSWGVSFGQAGFCYLTQRHFESVSQDAYAIRCAAEDPGDDSDPPPVQE